ncbi:MAG: cytochrome P450 [Proteobacteria bacterium]|nr:cytochrome P450 [Pseudomonadota bacterium]
MFNLYTPSPTVEERGADYFIAPHPKPRTQMPNLIEILMGSRHSLLDTWVEGSYRNGIDTHRILGRQVIFVNAPEWIKYVFVTRNSNFERKSPQMRRALEVLLGDGLFISEGETWKRRRPLVADIVHKTRVPSFGATMEQVTANFADGWAAKDGAEFELTAAMAELTAEIIAQTVFGRNLGSSAANQVIEGFTKYQHAVDNFNLGYFLGWDEGWPILHGPGKKRLVTMVHSVVEKVINDHLAGEGDEGSMVALLVKRAERSPGLGLDVTALRNEAATIFMAGHETTATTLTWAFYCLAHAPWVEQAMLDEIRAVCGDRAPTLADVPNLHWADAVVQETLRLYPPVPLLPRQAREADQIGDIPVKKGDLIMIAPWLMHRNYDCWENPMHFMPERFMNGARINPLVYFPFALGPRICPGMNFGLAEATLCLATLVQRFAVRPRAGYLAEPVCRLTLRPDGGLPVTAKERAAPRAKAA